MYTTAGALAVGVLAVGALTGCGDAGGEEPLGMPTVTTTPTPEPTPTPTPTRTSIVGVVLDMSDPELGIVFDEPPALSGDEADVYNWVATYEQEYWRTLLDNEASYAFEVFTSADLQTRMEEIAATNTADQSEFGGVYHVRISDITVDGNTATATTCDDYTEVTIVEPDGPLTLEELDLATPHLEKVTLIRDLRGEGVWIINLVERTGEC